jgi:hypothetical protein
MSRTRTEPRECFVLFDTRTGMYWCEGMRDERKRGWHLLRTSDGVELGRQISYPDQDDASRLANRFDAWMRATKGRGVPLAQWSPDIKARRGAKRAAEIKTPNEWVSL